MIYLVISRNLPMTVGDSPRAKARSARLSFMPGCVLLSWLRSASRVACSDAILTSAGSRSCGNTCRAFQCLGTVGGAYVRPAL